MLPSVSAPLQRLRAVNHHGGDASDLPLRGFVLGEHDGRCGGHSSRGFLSAQERESPPGQHLADDTVHRLQRATDLFMENAFCRSVEEVLRSFAVSKDHGLTDAQVEEHGRRFGRNEAPREQATPLWRLVLKQFDDQLVQILLAAAGISFVLALFEAGEDRTTAFFEPLVIVLILTANAIVGVVQETNAERAIEALKEYEPETATVLRDGAVRTVTASALVPGDVVEVAVGMRVPADCRLVELHSTRDEIARAGARPHGPHPGQDLHAVRRLHGGAWQGALHRGGRRRPHRDRQSAPQHHRDSNGGHAAATAPGRVWHVPEQGDLGHLCHRLEHQYSQLLEPAARWLSSRRRVLLQDRGGAGGGRHPGGIARGGHHLPGAGHQEDGPQECHCAVVAERGDARMHQRDLFGQDRHHHHQHDVGDADAGGGERRGGRRPGRRTRAGGDRLWRLLAGGGDSLARRRRGHRGGAGGVGGEDRHARRPLQPPVYRDGAVAPRHGRPRLLESRLREGAHVGIHPRPQVDERGVSPRGRRCAAHVRERRSGTDSGAGGVCAPARRLAGAAHPGDAQAPGGRGHRLERRRAHAARAGASHARRPAALGPPGCH
eukprot:ctg_510.g314